jgi:hypothetical protein
MFKKNINFGFDLKWDKFSQDEHFVKAMKFVESLDIDLSKHAVVNGVPIFFDPSLKAIGINLSGGADSTLLLYILSRLIEETGAKTEIIATTMIRFWELRSGKEENADKVLEVINDMFPRVKIKHLMGFVPTALEYTPLKNLVWPKDVNPNFSRYHFENAHADVYAVRNFSEYIAKRHGVSTTYSGTTMNPSHLLEDDKAPAFRKQREFVSNDALTYIPESINKDPFALIQKNWVMAQYQNFGLTELQEMTRSCEAGDKFLDGLFGKEQWTMEGSKYTCKRCFFCKERQWGTDTSGIFLESYHA